jgi:hypothetical protein
MVIAISVLAAIVVLAIVELGRFADTGPTAYMELAFPIQCELGSTVTGVISIENPSARASLPCHLRLGKEFFAGFDVLRMDPSPERLQGGPVARLYTFTPIPSRNKRSLKFYCRARSEGTFTLDVQLFDREAKLQAHRRVTIKVLGQNSGSQPQPA